MKRLILISMLVLPFLAHAQEANPKLENPGFEDGDKGWTLPKKDPMPVFIAEAARKGKLGLRIMDPGPGMACSVMSVRFPVKPGQKAKLEFWAKTTDEKCVSINFVYFSADKQWTTDASERLPGTTPTDFSGKWKKYEFEAIIPDYVTEIAVWVHTFTDSKGTADFDDFDLKIK